MADHGLDRQAGLDRIADDIRTLKQLVSEMRTLQPAGTDALNLQLSGESQAQEEVLAGEAVAFTMTLMPQDFGTRLFGVPSMSVYHTEVSGINKIGSGMAHDLEYDFAFWSDWGDSDNLNLVARAYVRNNSASTKTIIFRGNFRFLVTQASVS